MVAVRPLKVCPRRSTRADVCPAAPARPNDLQVGQPLVAEARIAARPARSAHQAVKSPERASRRARCRPLESLLDVEEASTSAVRTRLQQGLGGALGDADQGHAGGQHLASPKGLSGRLPAQGLHHVRRGLGGAGHLLEDGDVALQLGC